jgi:hypothetical protein
MLYFFFVVSTIIIFYNCFIYNTQEKLDTNRKVKNRSIQYKKMYKIIESKGEIDKDPYNRSIDVNVVKKFCKIANKYAINLDQITEMQFDFIYRKYVRSIIKKYNSKK